MIKIIFISYDVDGGETPGGSAGAQSCPNVLELENGDWAVIGIRATGLIKPYLTAGLGCGPDEEIVVLPKSVVQQLLTKI